jgi:hypothetical protein
MISEASIIAVSISCSRHASHSSSTSPSPSIQNPESARAVGRLASIHRFVTYGRVGFIPWTEGVTWAG